MSKQRLKTYSAEQTSREDRLTALSASIKNGAPLLTTTSSEHGSKYEYTTVLDTQTQTKHQEIAIKRTFFGEVGLLTNCYTYMAECCTHIIRMNTYSRLQFEHERYSGFGRLEWLFVLTASFVMLATIALSIERFAVLSVDYHFNSTEQNTTRITIINGSTKTRLASHQLETGSEQLCQTWTCTADFIFAVAFLINTCKFHSQYILE